MHPITKKLIHAFSWPIIGATLAYLYTYNVHKQSPSSLFIRRLTQVSALKHWQKVLFKHQDSLVRMLDRRYNDLPINPDWRVHIQSRKYFMDDMPVYVWNDSGQADQKTLLYLHGGGYIINATPFHFDFIREIIMRTQIRLVFPVYYKTPKYSYSEAYPLIQDLYQEWIDYVGPDRMFMMGDSAGGGFCLSLALSIRDLGLDQAKHLFLISPWLDLSLDHEDYLDYEKKDPLLNIFAMQKMGRFWAGKNDNVKDPYLSPIYGDMAGLPPIFICVGDHELLYLDSIRLKDALALKNQPYELIIGQKMNHIFPILPIFESKQVRKRIVSIINEYS